MSAWEDETLNEEVQAFIEFDEEGCGSFQFGYVRGVMDHYRTKNEIECVWLNSAGTEKTAQTARRWMVLDG